MGSERTTYIFLLLLCALIVVIPLPFASMNFFWRHVIEAIIFFEFALIFIFKLAGKIKFGNRENSAWRARAEAAFILFLVWCALLMVPISKTIFKAVFPVRAEVKAIDLINGVLSSSVGFGFWQGERELIVWICAFLLFFITTRLAISRNAIWVIISAIALSATFQSMYGIYEYATKHQHIFGYVKKYYTWCATGTFISRNQYAAYLLISLMVMWGASVYLWRRSNPGDKPKSLVLALWSLFVGAAMVASGARGEVVSAIIAIVGFHVMLANREAERIKPYYVALLFIVGVAVMAAWVGWEPLGARMTETGLKESGGRPTVWLVSLKMIREFGSFGVGLGSFEALYPRYRPLASGLSFDHAHNDYLELFAETGLVGFIILAAVLIFSLALLFEKLRTRKSSFAKTIGLACGMVAVGISLDALVNFPLRNPAVLWQLAIVLGVGAAAFERRKQGYIFIGEGINHKVKSLAIIVIALIFSLNSIRLAWGQKLSDRYRSIQKSAQVVTDVEQQIQVRKNILTRALDITPEDFRLHYELAKLSHREAVLKGNDENSYKLAIDHYIFALRVSPHNCQARLWAAIANMECRNAGLCKTSDADEACWFASTLNCCESCGQLNVTSLIWAIDKKDTELARKLVNRAVDDSASLIPQIVDLLWNKLGRTRAEALVLKALPKDPDVYEMFAQDLFTKDQLLSADRFWRESKALEGAIEPELTLFDTVRNGGFEDSLEADPFGWQVYQVDGASIERSSAGCREGVHCLKLEFSGATKDYYQMHQDIALFAGLYEIDAWLKVENANNYESVGIELVRPEEPDKAVVQLFADVGVKEWQNVRKTFLVRNFTERLRLRVRRISGGNTAQNPILWIDGIHLVKVEP